MRTQAPSPFCLLAIDRPALTGDCLCMIAAWLWPLRAVLWGPTPSSEAVSPCVYTIPALDWSTFTANLPVPAMVLRVYFDRAFVMLGRRAELGCGGGTCQRERDGRYRVLTNGALLSA